MHAHVGRRRGSPVSAIAHLGGDIRIIPARSAGERAAGGGALADSGADEPFVAHRVTLGRRPAGGAA